MWNKRALLKRASLNKRAGVKVGNSASATEHMGLSTATSSTLLDFLKGMEKAGKLRDEQRELLFDQTLFCQSFRDLCTQHAIPTPWLQVLHGDDEYDPEAPNFRPYVSIGPSRTGVTFHSHQDAVFSLLHGEKSWTLIPPDTLFASNTQMSAELRAAFPSCRLRPGEMLWVPEGWTHATFNHGEAVGLSLQANRFRSALARTRFEASILVHRVLAETQGGKKFGPDSQELLDLLEDAVIQFPSAADLKWQLLGMYVRQWPWDDRGQMPDLKKSVGSTRVTLAPAIARVFAAVLELPEYNCDGLIRQLEFYGRTRLPLPKATRDLAGEVYHIYYIILYYIYLYIYKYI
jgi:hypothetical protein